jgi:hypothetical protein
MKRIKEIWRPRKMVCVILELVDQERIYHAVKCPMKSLHPADLPSTSRFGTWEEVVKHFGKSTPYHLHVLGSGVLSRMVESVPNVMDELIINGNPEDFVFSSFDDGQRTAASFFRKSLIEGELAYSAQEKLHLLGLSAGYAPLLTLAETVHIQLEFNLSFENGQLRQFERAAQSQDKCTFEGRTIQRNQACCAAIVRVQESPPTQYAFSGAAQFIPARENFTQFNQFRITGVFAVGVILCALVGNYFYVNRLNSDIAQLELDLSVSNESLAMLSRLEDEKQRKEQLVLSAGVNSSRFLSFYLDEIGRTVPKHINLQELQVFPLESKLKNKQKVEVNKSTVRIAGSTLGNEVLDNWIEQMDRFEWVQDIELLNYLKTEGERSDFLLLITLTK